MILGKSYFYKKVLFCYQTSLCKISSKLRIVSPFCWKLTIVPPLPCSFSITSEENLSLRWKANFYFQKLNLYEEDLLSSWNSKEKEIVKSFFYRCIDLWLWQLKDFKFTTIKLASFVSKGLHFIVVLDFTI